MFYTFVHSLARSPIINSPPLLVTNYSLTRSVAYYQQPSIARYQLFTHSLGRLLSTVLHCSLPTIHSLARSPIINSPPLLVTNYSLTRSVAYYQQSSIARYQLFTHSLGHLLSTVLHCSLPTIHSLARSPIINSPPLLVTNYSLTRSVAHYQQSSIARYQLFTHSLGRLLSTVLHCSLPTIHSLARSPIINSPPLLVTNYSLTRSVAYYQQSSIARYQLFTHSLGRPLSTALHCSLPTIHSLARSPIINSPPLLVTNYSLTRSVAYYQQFSIARYQLFTHSLGRLLSTVLHCSLPTIHSLARSPIINSPPLLVTNYSLTRSVAYYQQSSIARYQLFTHSLGRLLSTVLHCSLPTIHSLARSPIINSPPLLVTNYSLTRSVAHYQQSSIARYQLFTHSLSRLLSTVLHCSLPNIHSLARSPIINSPPLLVTNYSLTRSVAYYQQSSIARYQLFTHSLSRLLSTVLHCSLPTIHSLAHYQQSSIARYQLFTHSLGRPLSTVLHCSLPTIHSLGRSPSIINSPPLLVTNYSLTRSVAHYQQSSIARYQLFTHSLGRLLSTVLHCSLPTIHSLARSPIINSPPLLVTNYSLTRSVAHNQQSSIARYQLFTHSLGRPLSTVLHCSLPTIHSLARSPIINSPPLLVTNYSLTRSVAYYQQFSIARYQLFTHSLGRLLSTVLHCSLPTIHSLARSPIINSPPLLVTNYFFYSINYFE